MVVHTMTRRALSSASVGSRNARIFLWTRQQSVSTCVAYTRCSQFLGLPVMFGQYLCVCVGVVSAVQLHSYWLAGNSEGWQAV
jgi:hypothetical protein